MQLPRFPQSYRTATSMFVLLLTVSICGRAQSPADAFHWVNFHDSKDAPMVQWVTESLRSEHWTEIREIGVQWDAALVVTSERKSPQGAPPADIYTVWNVSLSRHEGQPLLHASNPHILDWTNFTGSTLQAPELGLVYDDCYACETASTYFTTLYYNIQDHAWRARWIRGDQAAALWNAGKVDGVTKTQVYGLLVEPTGRQILGTWTHFDYGKVKPAEDFLFQYSVDPGSGSEQILAQSGKHADEMMQRLCKADPSQLNPALAQLARGQDSALCTGQVSSAPKTGRRPTTTPPANNRGRSTPPGSHKQ
jgi:hypothetical protein